MIMSNKKIGMFRVKLLNILGKVGTHILFLIILFSGKNIILYILNDISLFKLHKIIFLPENLNKNSRFH